MRCWRESALFCLKLLRLLSLSLIEKTISRRFFLSSPSLYTSSLLLCAIDVASEASESEATSQRKNDGSGWRKSETLFSS